MGRRIWVINPGGKQKDLEGNEYFWPSSAYDCRVLSFKAFLGAGPVATDEPKSHNMVREKHLIQVWTDPGGLRTLTVGSIRLKDPRKVKAGQDAAATKLLNQQDEEEDGSD